MIVAWPCLAGDSGEAARLLAGLPCWVQLAGVCDVLLAARTRPGLSPGGRGGRPSLEDGLLSAWLGPFGWLLLAEPVDEGTLEELTSQVALAQLEAQRSDSPRAKLAERRAAARHAELRQAASTGLWRVHLLAGAATPEQAAQVAGLLRASTDLAGLPYALLPARRAAAPPERNHEPAARRPLPGDPGLAVGGSRAAAAAMIPSPAGAGGCAGVGGGAVAVAAAVRPVLRLHGAGRRAGPGARAGGARPADGRRARTST